MKTIFLLGADDPEMRAIEKVLRKNKKPEDVIVHASIKHKRVTPGSAYQADPVPNVSPGSRLVRIECEPTTLPANVEVVVIDHHREGDPGFEFGPEKFWEASSIGQLHRLLNIEPSQWRLAIAAMDHCFSSALRGECPGVIGGEVLLMGVHEIVSNAQSGHPRAIQSCQRTS